MLVDAENNRTINQYDRLNRLTATAVNPQTGLPSNDFSKPASGDVVVVNGYDRVGNLVRVADGMAQKRFVNGTSTLDKNLGHVTEFYHDGLGRKVAQTWDAGSSVAKHQFWSYNALVETGFIDAANQAITKEYDQALRVVFETHLIQRDRKNDRFFACHPAAG